MEVNKKNIIRVDVTPDRVLEYLSFVEGVKKGMEHPEWLGDFSEEEIQELRVDALENKWFSFYCGGNLGLAINEKTDMVIWIWTLLFQKMNLRKCKRLWINV